MYNVKFKRLALPEYMVKLGTNPSSSDLEYYRLLKVDMNLASNGQRAELYMHHLVLSHFETLMIHVCFVSLSVDITDDVC